MTAVQADVHFTPQTWLNASTDCGRYSCFKLKGRAGRNTAAPQKATNATQPLDAEDLKRITMELNGEILLQSNSSAVF
jgi:hypothetical protein